jgi:predicted N-acyltransferase
LIDWCYSVALTVLFLKMEVKQIHSMEQIDGAAWNRLTGKSYPIFRHEFLLALEQSGSVCEQTGWLPAHLLVMDQ